MKHSWAFIVRAYCVIDSECFEIIPSNRRPLTELCSFFVMDLQARRGQRNSGFKLVDCNEMI